MAPVVVDPSEKKKRKKQRKQRKQRKERERGEGDVVVYRLMM